MSQQFDYRKTLPVLEIVLESLAKMLKEINKSLEREIEIQPQEEKKCIK